MLPLLSLVYPTTLSHTTIYYYFMTTIQALRTSSAFPGLEEFEAIDRKRETYLGPTMESNWVLPGRLLVGAYPASMNDSHHAHLLCTILLQGVSTFVCLQQEYRSEGVTEEMWRSGDALRPYFQDVLQLLRKLQELKAADPRAVPAICAPQDTDFVHFPIVDCNIADDNKVSRCLLIGIRSWCVCFCCACCFVGGQRVTRMSAL